MDNHLKAWRAHRLLSWIYALLVLAAAYAAFRTDGLVRMDAALLSSGLFVALAIFHAWAGRGALARRPWARIASIFSGFVLLLVFPIGTPFGAYLLSASWNPWDHVTTSRSPSASGWPADAVRDRPKISGGADRRF